MAKLKDIGTAKPEFWIHRSWLDMIVGCGAWSAPLLLVSYLSVASNTLKWSIAFYALALFFNYPHYMATVYRAYHRSEDFNKYRIFTVHITLLLLATAVVSHFWFKALPLLFTLYVTWSPWHYSGQNYGILMMFARRAGAEPANAERGALYAAFLLSYAILFVNFHTGLHPQESRARPEASPHSGPPANQAPTQRLNREISLQTRIRGCPILTSRSLRG